MKPFDEYDKHLQPLVKERTRARAMRVVRIVSYGATHAVRSFDLDESTARTACGIIFSQESLTLESHWRSERGVWRGQVGCSNCRATQWYWLRRASFR